MSPASAPSLHRYGPCNSIGRACLCSRINDCFADVCCCTTTSALPSFCSSEQRGPPIGAGHSQLVSVAVLEAAKQRRPWPGWPIRSVEHHCQVVVAHAAHVWHDHTDQAYLARKRHDSTLLPTTYEPNEPTTKPTTNAACATLCRTHVGA